MSKNHDSSIAPADGRTLSPQFDRAVELALRLHRHQTRKGSTIPYAAHLLAVAGLVLEHDGTEDEAIAALLHDAIEDQGSRYSGGSAALRAEIEQQFGSKVLEIVNACTDSDTEQKADWWKRKAAYIANLRERATRSVLLVAVADKVHNARCMLTDYRQVGEAVWERFNPQSGGRAGQLWYYGQLVELFRERGPPALAQELYCTVQDLCALIDKNRSGSYAQKD